MSNNDFETHPTGTHRILDEKDQEIQRLTAEVTKYCNWFDENGANLATHRNIALNVV